MYDYTSECELMQIVRSYTWSGAGSLSLRDWNAPSITPPLRHRASRPQVLRSGDDDKEPDMWMLNRDREQSVRTLELYLTPAEASALSDKLRRLLVDPEGGEH